MSASHEIRYQHGADHMATVELAPGTPYPATITWDGVRYQDVPLDAADYRYTHGGEEYRAAVEAAWAAPWWPEAERAIRAGASPETDLTEEQEYEILLAYIDAGNEPTADGRHPGPMRAQEKRAHDPRRPGRDT